MANSRLWDGVFKESPNSSNGWSFNTETGNYTKTVPGFISGATIRFRVSGAGAEDLLKIDPVYKPEPTNLQGPAEQNDKYFMGAIPETLIYQTVNFPEPYPYKVKIFEPTEKIESNPLVVKFNLFDPTYDTEITDATNIQFIVKATEANDYDKNANQTVVEGTVPSYSDGYWRSQLNLHEYGKYRIEVKAKNVFWPKDSVVSNYPASADFEVIDIRPPTTTFLINPENPDGLNGWYNNELLLKCRCQDE